jgi:hypothetical protein
MGRAEHHLIRGEVVKLAQTMRLDKAFCLARVDRLVSSRRYGLQICSPTFSGLGCEAPMKSVTKLHRSSAIQAYRDLLVRDLHPLVIRAARAHALLQINLAGVGCNRDAVGARVYVSAGGPSFSSEAQTGASYLSQNDPRLHFGLSNSQTYDHIEVQWPGGKRERFRGGPANRIITLKEGSGSPAKR